MTYVVNAPLNPNNHTSRMAYGVDNTIRPPPLQPFYNSGTTRPIGTNETPFKSGGRILSAVEKMVTSDNLGDLQRSTLRFRLLQPFNNSVITTPINLPFGLVHSDVPALWSIVGVISPIPHPSLCFSRQRPFFGARMVTSLYLRGHQGKMTKIGFSCLWLLTHIQINTTVTSTMKPEVTIFKTADEIAYSESTVGAFVSIGQVVSELYNDCNRRKRSCPPKVTEVTWGHHIQNGWWNRIRSINWWCFRLDSSSCIIEWLT